MSRVLLVVGLQLYLTHTFIGRAIMAVAQDQLALRLLAVDPIRIKRIAFGISIATASLAGALLIIIQPIEPSVGREYIGRVFAICVLGGMGSLPGTLIAAMLLGIVESFTATFYGPSWAPAVAFGFLLLTRVGASRPAGILAALRSESHCVIISSVLQIAKFVPSCRTLRRISRSGHCDALLDLLPLRPRRRPRLLAALGLGNDYVFFAGYVVLQYIVLATAWNILGGYCGYVNFGTAAFFALGAYSSVALHKLGANVNRYASGFLADILHLILPLSLPSLVIVGGIVSGIVGLGMGYLTLRLRGVFFAIATLAMAVVLQTLMINWDFVGGSRGAYVIRPNTISAGPVTLSYIEYLFLVMLVLAVVALTVARLIERSRLGIGFSTIRDDEMAAEAAGVPTLRLKLIATMISGAFMGMAGAPLPYYLGYIEPSSAFGLPYAVNSIAMPMIGGTTSWVGPLIGAILLGSLQQIATVTISSAVNLLIVGVLLVAFVIIAPAGIVGLVESWRRTRARATS